MTDVSTRPRVRPRPRPRRVRRTLRWLLGAGSLLGGFTWMLINLDNPSALTDALVGCVLAAGGVVLLMPHRVRLPRGATAAVMIASGLIGTALGLLGSRVLTYTYGADHYFFRDRGWPFYWAEHGAASDDPGTAARVASSADWHFDLIALAGSLLFYAYLGMLAVVIADRIRRSHRP